MRPKREKLRIYFYNMIVLYWQLIQEDVNQENSEERVLEPEDKRVIDEKQKKHTLHYTYINFIDEIESICLFFCKYAY